MTWLRGRTGLVALVLVDVGALAVGGRAGVAVSAVAGLLLLGLAVLRPGPVPAPSDRPDAAGDPEQAEPPVAWESTPPVEIPRPAAPPAPAPTANAQQVVDETAGAVIGELCALIDQIDTVRRSAMEVDEQAARTERVTRSTISQAEAADQRVEELTGSLSELSGMTQLIAGIAGQTRMLALNATIEAVRAGDAGRGFGVVADEVKSLAASSARSTDQIAATLTRLDAVTRAVAESLGTMSSEISGLDDASTALAGVASRQFALVDQLDAALASTVQKVTALSTLNDRQERRTAERREVDAPITLTWPGGSASGRLRDLSSTGLRCALNGAVMPAEGAEVTVEVQASTGSFSTPAVVAREIPAESGREFGLFFTRVPADASAAISAVLAAAAPLPSGSGAAPAGGPTGAATDDDLLAGIDLF